MKYIFFVLCWWLAGTLSAQQLKGRVLEAGKDGNVGLPGANVYWLGIAGGVATDVDGNSAIEKRPNGRLIVSFVGYASDTLKIGEKDHYIEVILKAGHQLDEAKVFKRGQTTIMNTKSPVIEQVITGEELCKAACCNLGESFTTNASVDVSYADAVTGAKQIQLLGLNGKYVQMMTENMPNFRGVSVLYGLNYVPGPWMSAISVSKGVGSVTNVMKP